jgi:hypothetical protein
MPHRRRPKHLDGGARELGLHVGLALALALGAAAGISWAAGFAAVHQRLVHPQVLWLLVALAGLRSHTSDTSVRTGP